MPALCSAARGDCRTLGLFKEQICTSGSLRSTFDALEQDGATAPVMKRLIALPLLVGLVMPAVARAHYKETSALASLEKRDDCHVSPSDLYVLDTKKTIAISAPYCFLFIQSH